MHLLVSQLHEMYGGGDPNSLKGSLNVENNESGIIFRGVAAAAAVTFLKRMDRK